MIYKELLGSVIQIVMEEGMARSIENGASGLNPKKGPDATFLEGMEDFDELPEWLSQEDIDYFVSQFEN